MDTSFHGTMTVKLKRQICEILQSPFKELKVKVLPVQQQGCTLDCGPFAIAYAWYVAKYRCNPSNAAFDQSKLRSHILTVLKDNVLTDFPLSTQAVVRCPPKEMILTLYCSCRTIWTAADNSIYGRYCIYDSLYRKLKSFMNH